MNRRIAVAAGEVVLFQLVWFAAVAGAGAGRVWIGPLAVGALLAFAAARLPVGRRARLAATATALAAIGFVVDSFVQVAGLLRFAGAADGPWAPPWIVAMWAQLAVALPALAPLARRLWLAAPLGAVGGPLAYAAGVDLGAAELTASPAATYFALAAIWALAVPLLALWSSRAAASAPRPTFSQPPTRSESVG
ncbi:MAG: DUF2878 domain-containing protein [Thermoanaerobaculia bacterium]|nr:DUF2878 domain-containing protein [Thermoanaerobaculia bacterium]